MHRPRTPLAGLRSPVLLLLGALALLALTLLGPARPAFLADSPVAAAWKQARAAGGYHFTADIVQTLTPQATAANLGRESRQERFRIEGETDLGQGTMRFLLWSQGGSAADPAGAVEVKVEAGRAMARQPGQGWQEIGDIGSGMAPGGDFMAFLAGARAIQPLDAVSRAGQRFERYQFEVDGAAFAQAVRGQLEQQLHASGELPPGARLGLPEQYARMQGSGEIWLDARGLPARQELRLSFPPTTGDRVEAHIVVDFAQFAAPAAGGFVAPAQLLPLARQLLAGLTFVLLTLGAGLLLIRHAGSRALYRAIVALTVGSMLATPQLQSAQAGASQERQAARAAARQQQEQAAEAQRAAFAAQQPAQPAAAALAAIRADDHRDQDRDGRGDLQELLQHSNPLAPEAAPQAAPLALNPEDPTDSDRDGLTDYEEALLGTSSSPRDRNGDALADGQDSDRDRLPDPLELAGYGEANGTRRFLDPLAPDSNGDQLDDGREWGLAADGQRRERPQDTDNDGTSDLFDEDNDGDGVYDWLDLSPFSANGATFTRANPLSLSFQGLTPNTTALVEFQLRPTDPKRLWYAFNVLNWPENDSEGQMQDVDGKTFADVDSNARLPADANGDVKLVPMLEITIEQTLANLATSGATVDKGLYDRYGIAVEPLSTSGGSLVYTPLHLVTDPRSGEQVAFHGRMLYRPGAAWGRPHQVRVVWMVQALVDKNCYPDPQTNLLRCDRYNKPEGIHVYYEDWRLTALNLREDHGVRMALITERPELTPDPTATGLLLLARGLERTFLAGRDCDRVRDGVCEGDGTLDFSVAEIARRFDLATNDGVAAAERWNLPDSFEVRTRDYADLDAAAFDATRPETLAAILPAGRDQASVLFARDERLRSLNLDEQTVAAPSIAWSGTSLLLNLSGRPIEQLAALSIAPYQRSGGMWAARPIDQQIAAMESGFGLFYSQATARGAMSLAEAQGRTALAKAYYLALRSGSAERVLLDGEPIHSTPGLADVAVYSAVANTALGLVMNFTNSALQVVMDTEKVFAVTSQSGVQSKLLEAFRLIFDDMELSPYDFVRKGFSADLLKTGFDVLLGEAVLAGMFLGASAILAGAITSIIGATTGDPGLVRTGTLIVQSASLAMSIYFQAIKPVLQVVAAVYNLVKDSGESLIDAVGMVLAGTSNVIGSNIISSVIGLVIQVAIIWGMVLVQALISGAAVGSLELSLIVSSAIASTVLAVLAFALSLTVVGTLVVGIAGLIDGLLAVLCSSNVRGACWGISDFVSKQLTRYFFDYQPLVGLNTSDLIRPASIKVLLDNEQLGYQEGNRARLTAVLSTTLQHVFPEANATGALLFNIDKFLTRDNLRSANFDYRLQRGSQPLALPEVNRGGDWQGLQSFPVSYRFNASLAIPVERTSYLHRGVLVSSVSTTETVTLRAGLNTSFSAQLASSFNIPAAECWGTGWVSSCNDQRLTGRLPITPFGVKLDVFPASLDVFYAGGWDPQVLPPLDRDGDGLRAGGGADPSDTSWDRDGDGLSDGFEVASSASGLGSVAFAADTDSDGLSDPQERRAGSSSFLADSDHDGLSDKLEVEGWLFTYGPNKQTLATSNPARVDSDGDGLSDKLEYDLHRSDPLGAPLHPRVPNAAPAFSLNQELSDRDGIVGLGQTVTITSTIAADPESSSERLGLGFVGTLLQTLPAALGGTQLRTPINATPRRPNVTATSFTVSPGGRIPIQPYTVASQAEGQFYRAELSSPMRWAQPTTSDLLLRPAGPGIAAVSAQIASSPAPGWPRPLLLASLEGRQSDLLQPVQGRSAARIVVRQAGSVIDTAQLALDDGSAPKQLQPPALACAADGACLVAWAEWRDGYDIYAALVRPGLQAGPAFALAAGPGDATLPAVASDGASFVVGWQRGEALFTRVIANDGAPLTGEQRLDDHGGAVRPAANLVLAWAGDRYLAAWERQVAPGDRDVWLAALGADGAFVAGSEQAVAATGADEALPQLAYEPHSRRALLLYSAGGSLLSRLVVQGVAQAGSTALAAVPVTHDSLVTRAAPDLLNGGWTIVLAGLDYDAFQALSVDADNRLRATPLALQRRSWPIRSFGLSCLPTECALITTSGLVDSEPRLQTGAIALRAEPQGPSTVTLQSGGISFLIDGTAPELQLTSHPSRLYMLPASTLIVGGTASDQTGVRSVEVRFNDGPWQPANGAENWSYAITVPPGERRHTIALRAADHADNLTTPPPATLLIDGTAPRITADVAPGTLLTPNPHVAGGWEIRLRGTAIDPDLGDGSPGSGARTVEVMLTPNSGGWQRAFLTSSGQWSLAYRLGADGAGETLADPTATYQVIVRARDELGNGEQPADHLRTSVRVDMRPPTPRVLFPAPLVGTAPDGTRVITDARALLAQTNVITGVIDDTDASAGIERAELSLIPAGEPLAPGDWRGVYRNDAGDGPPVLVRDDPALDLRWAAGPGQGVNPDGFSVEWTRETMVRASGSYTITAEVEPGGQLQLYLANNPQPILVAEGAAASKEVLLNAGTLPLRVVYRHGSGEARVRLGFALNQPHGYLVDLDASGPSVSRTTWSLTPPADHEGIYQLRMRTRDLNLNRTAAPGDDVWRGEIDSAPPRIALRTEYLGLGSTAQTRYTLSVTDLNLAEERVSSPCDLRQAARTYYDDEWWRTWVRDPSRLYELHVSCRVPGHIAEQPPVRACDRYGNCATANDPRPRPPGVRGLYWADLSKVGRLGLDTAAMLDIAVDPATRPGGVLVDPLDERVYWSGFDTIDRLVLMRANLDGSAATEVYRADLPTSGLADPPRTTLALDRQRNAIVVGYVAQGELVYRTINLNDRTLIAAASSSLFAPASDSSLLAIPEQGLLLLPGNFNGRTVLYARRYFAGQADAGMVDLGPASRRVGALAYDPLRQAIFYAGTDLATGAEGVRRVPLVLDPRTQLVDRSAPVLTLDSGFRPQALALDPAGQQLFVGGVNGGIVRASFDGSGLTTLDPRTSAYGLAFDVVQRPTVDDQLVTAASGTPVSFTLQARDPNGAGLRYTILGPEVGTLSGVPAPDQPVAQPPTLTYMPPPGFKGSVQLTVRVDDGRASAGGAVSIVVEPSERLDAAILTPTDRAMIKTLNPIALQGSAFAANGVAEVVLRVDGQEFARLPYAGQPESSVSWSASWTPPREGTFVFSAQVRDRNGQEQTELVTTTVIVDVADPRVTLDKTVFGADGEVQAGSVLLQGTATDSQGVAEVIVIAGEEVKAVLDHGAGCTRCTWRARVPITSDPAGQELFVALRVFDVVGRVWTDELSDNVMADIVPPDLGAARLVYTRADGAEAVVPEDGLIRDAQSAGSPGLRLRWEPASDRTGITRYYAQWSTSPTPALQDATPLDPDGAREHALTLSPSEGAAFYAHLAAEDRAGNRTWQTLGPIYLDSPRTPDRIDDLTYDGWLTNGASLMSVDARVIRADSTITGSQQLALSWDADQLRLAWSGANWDHDGDLFVYVDSVGGGTRTAYNPYAAPLTLTMPAYSDAAFEADYLIQVEDSATARLWRWSGGAWQQVRDFPTTPSDGMLYRFEQRVVSPRTDLLLPFSLLGVANPAGGGMRLLAFATEEEALRLWATAPAKNPLNSARAADPALPLVQAERLNLSQFFAWSNLGSGQLPNAGQLRLSDFRLSLSARPGGPTVGFLGDGAAHLLAPGQPLDADLDGRIDVALPVAGSAPLGEGQVVTYTLSYRNAGSAAADLRLRLRAGGGLRLPSGSPTELTVPAVPAGGEGSLVISGTISTAGGVRAAELAVVAWDETRRNGAGLDSEAFDWLAAQQVIDRTPPEAPRIFPPVDAIGLMPYAITGRAVDDAGVGQITLEIQPPTGAPQTLTCATEASSARWRCDWTPSMGGEHRLRARATDRWGNVGPWGEPVSLTVDATPPTLALDDATEQLLRRTLAQSELRLGGRADDDRRIERIEICSLNGRRSCARTLVGDGTAAGGSWAALLSGDGDGDGDTRALAFYAVDAAGNRSTAPLTRTLRLDTVAPQLTVDGALPSVYLGRYWEQAAPERSAAPAPPVLTGTVRDGDAVAGVYIRLELPDGTVRWESVVIDGERWHYTPRLAVAGSYWLTPEAYDRAGNRSEEGERRPLDVLPSSDLALSFTTAPDSVSGDEPLSYTLVAINRGASPSNGAVLSVALPDGAQLAELPSGCSRSGSQLQCELGVLAVGASVSSAITLRVPRTLQTVALQAVVSGREHDPAPSNNQATAITWRSAQVRHRYYLPIIRR